MFLNALPQLIAFACICVGGHQLIVRPTFALLSKRYGWDKKLEAQLFGAPKASRKIFWGV